MAMKRVGFGVMFLSAMIGLLGLAAPVSAAPAADSTAPAGTGYAAQGLPVQKPAEPGQFGRQAHLDGVCQIFELCVFSGPNLGGAVMRDFFNGVADWKVTTPNIANNDESAQNNDFSFTAVLCTNAGFSGQCGLLAPGAAGNAASPFVNNTESNTWAF